MNCLEYSLLQWEKLPDFRLWYNSNHVVIIEPHICLRDKGYLPVEEFGADYFIRAFNLTCYFNKQIKSYIQSLKEVPAGCDKAEQNV